MRAKPIEMAPRSLRSWFSLQLLLASVMCCSADAVAAGFGFDSFFTDQGSVALGNGSTTATIMESESISVVTLENDPSLGDPTVLIPGEGNALQFDYDFEEASGDSDLFAAVLFDADLGPDIGVLETLEVNSSASGTAQFSLDRLGTSSLGVMFQLLDLSPATGSATSVVTLNNLRFINASDNDGDGISNVDDNCVDVSNGSQLNTDGDTLGNACDVDDDDDGLTDEQEATLGTDPLLADSDGDGWTDGEEVDGGTDPLSSASQPALSTGLPIWLLYEATR